MADIHRHVQRLVARARHATPRVRGDADRLDQAEETRRREGAQVAAASARRNLPESDRASS